MRLKVIVDELLRCESLIMVKTQYPDEEFFYLGGEPLVPENISDIMRLYVLNKLLLIVSLPRRFPDQHLKEYDSNSPQICLIGI